MLEDDLDSPGVVPSDSDDQEEDNTDYKHAKLLDAITSLDGKKKLSAAQRSVPANQISEFNFSASTDGGKVKLHELVGTLRDTTSHGTLKKQLRAVQKRAKVVATPLPRVEQERIQRSLAYETTSKEITKWDPVVDKNRKAEQLRFPLQQPDLKVLTRTDEFIKRFQARTPLEKEVAALLHGSDSVMKSTQVLSAAEQRALDAMSLEEAKLRRAELQKYRALLSYKEAKARWQKKIKSKSYHKHLRKSRQKEELKAVEELKKNDPEAYMEKMKQIEKSRIEERMNLKHRGGSKFIQKQKMYSKYQDQARQAVQDMYQKSRELTKKTAVESDSEESIVSEEGEDELHLVERDTKGNNPWMSVNSGKKIRIKPLTTGSGVDPSKEKATEDVDKSETGVDDRLMMQKGGKRSEQELGSKSPNTSSADRKSKHSMKMASLHKTVTSKREDNQHLSQESVISTKRKKKELKEGAAKGSDKEVDSGEDEDEVEDDVDSEGGDDSEDGENSEDEDSDAENGTNVDIDTLFSKLDKKKDKPVRKVKEKKTAHVLPKKQTVNSDNVEDEEDEETYIEETLTKKTKFEDFDEDDEEEEETQTSSKRRELKQNNEKQVKTSQDSAPEVFVDPKKLFTMETQVKSASLPDVVVNEDEDMGEDEQRMTIAEAFADDDVIEEFALEKEEVTKRQKAKDIDLMLPGWGHWGGTGIKVNKRKRRRFLIKAPQGPPRKDRKLGIVIISEQKDDAIAKHQVSHLPFPYTNVQQFERSIRAPVGKTWNPETAFKKMTKPKVVSRLGTVIKPIDKSQMFEKEKQHRKNKVDIAFSSDDKSQSKGKRFKRKPNRK